MNHFGYRNGVLHCEDVSLEAIARELGTPAYVYSDATLRRHYQVPTDSTATHIQRLKKSGGGVPERVKKGAILRSRKGTE